MGEKNNLWSFDHLEREKSEEFVKTVYVSETESPRRRGRLVVRWKDKVKEYMHQRVADRGGLEQAKIECMNRERWRLFCLVGRSWREQDF